MRKLLSAFIVAVAASGFAVGAQAAVITDIYEPVNGVALDNQGPGSDAFHEYQHTLLSPPHDPGFDPAIDTLVSATLTIEITGAGGQTLEIMLDGDSNLVFEDSLNQLGDLAVDFVYLEADGLLDVRVTNTGNTNFTFVRSTLEAEFTEGSGNGNGNGDPAAVPEPAVLGLLGMGLIGLGLVAQRRRRIA